jgi:hypothetical protein
MTKDDRYGATDDTYADEPETLSETQPPAQTESESADTSEDITHDEETPTEATPPTDNALPFIFARRTVKADREALPVYIQSETARMISDAERQLEQQFTGDKIMSLDVREALVRAGLQNLDRAEQVMREWGYGRRDA